jgi:hypothetical protein
LLNLDESDPDGMKAAVRKLFEDSGLDVRRVTVTKRRGHRYVFVSAAFKDVNRISYTRAFPDLRVGLRREDVFYSIECSSDYYAILRKLLLGSILVVSNKSKKKVGFSVCQIKYFQLSYKLLYPLFIGKKGRNNYHCGKVFRNAFF